MPTDPDIRMSELVREVLGAEMIRHVLATPLTRARCPSYREPVPSAGPVNVVVSIIGLSQEIAFTHPGCAPSAVMRGRRPVNLVAESGMAMTAMFMRDDSGLLTGLIGERESPAYLRSGTPGGERIDVGVADALNRGFDLVPRLDAVPRRELGWAAAITDNGSKTSQLVINPTDLFYEGDLQLPPGWREVTVWRGWCVLYTGTGLRDPETGDLTPQSLEAAAQAGTLVGGRLRITWTPT